MPIRPELLDELLKDCQNPQDWLGEGGILKQLTKAVVERALDAEMDMHLQATKQSAAGKPDRRSGHSQKTFKGEFGQVSIEVPRNRQGEFEPQMVKKRQTRLDGFDEKILALYARGMTVREASSSA